MNLTLHHILDWCPYISKQEKKLKGNGNPIKTHLPSTQLHHSPKAHKSIKKPDTETQLRDTDRKTDRQIERQGRAWKVGVVVVVVETQSKEEKQEGMETAKKEDEPQENGKQNNG